MQTVVKFKGGYFKPESFKVVYYAAKTVLMPELNFSRGWEVQSSCVIDPATGRFCAQDEAQGF